MNIRYLLLAIVILLVLLLVYQFLLARKKYFKNIITRYNIEKNVTIEKLDLGIKEYKREPVQKKIYRIWLGCNKNKECGGRKLDMKLLEKSQKLSPDWEQVIIYDEDAKSFLEKEFGKDSKITKAFYLINPKYGAARADLLRYLLIYKYGGLYLDIKSCIKGPIPEMPKDKDMWISKWSEGIGPNKHLFPKTGEYINWYIYARKGCPLLKEIIERVVHNIYTLHENPNNNINISESLFKNLGGTETKSKGNVLCTTGPIAMTIAIFNSNQINNVQDDISINNVLEYYCIKDNFSASKNHYSQQTEPLIFAKKDINYIPKVVYMTYHDIDSIPQYVFNNINKYCSGYEIKIYNDNMCLEFLEKYYGKKAVEIFNNMEIGAHKADFWRYCILYVFGGYYFDIKTDFKNHINEIYDSKKEKTWYTVICGDKSCLYNGIIVTPPHNPIILDAIKYIYNNPIASNYHNYVRELLNILTKYCKNKVKIGVNQQKNDWQCILFQEICFSNCFNNCDRYGLNCIIIDEAGKKVFNTRYKDFGSWKSQRKKGYTLVNDLENTENPYNTGTKLLWPNNDEEFLKNNWPSTFDFDKEIKEDIVNRSRELPLNYAIIDCGAHIGDGAIPIAGALKSMGREDIIVYAIDPGLEKIEFITEMRNKNHLNNLRIINCGLSDKNIVYNHIKRNKEDHWGNNTGGTEWVNSQSEKADKNSEIIEFKKLDDLVSLGTISEKIGYIHLDVEGMEDKAILGGLNSIMKYKPILSLEEHNMESSNLKDILEPLGYKYIKRLGSNNIYEYTK